jgi:hypothetical protein
MSTVFVHTCTTSTEYYKRAASLSTVSKTSFLKTNLGTHFLGIVSVHGRRGKLQQDGGKKIRNYFTQRRKWNYAIKG